MAYFILLPSEDLPRKEVGLTYQFVLSPHAIEIDPKSLYNNELWIAISYRNSTIYLWSLLSVSSIEELWEQDILLGYLLSGDIETSDYLFRLGQPTDRCLIESSTWIKSIRLNKVTEIDTPIAEELQSIIEGCCPIRMTKPNLRNADYVPPSQRDVPTIIRFRSIIQQLKRAYTLSDLYRYYKYPDLPPYESFACSYLEQENSDIYKVIYSTVRPDSDNSSPKEAWQQVRTVDITLRTLITEDIHVRRFINPPASDIDSLGADNILKTDRAEAIHQKMLADLTSRIYSLQLIPYETNSMDLFIEGSNGCIVIEIKSATRDNFYRQSLKGAIQAKEYSYAVHAQRGFTPTTVVVVQHVENDTLEAYCRGFLSYLGIEMLLYKGKLEWPERVVGFDGMVSGIM